MNSKQVLCSLASLAQRSSRILLASTFLLATSTSFLSSSAANREPFFATTDLPQLANPTELLAQANSNSIFFFYTPNYVAHVFRDGNEIRMNVFDPKNNVIRLNRAIASNTILNSKPSYIAFGSFNGQQATYIVSITGNRSNPQARLIIRNANQQSLVDEFSTRFDAFNPPPDMVFPDDPGSGGQQTDLLMFQTQSYAVRVFERGRGTFMNVHDRIRNVTLVNGGAATLLTPQAPYEDAVSYVASATDGTPLKYIARYADNQGILEIQNINSQTLKEEDSVGTVTGSLTGGATEASALVEPRWVAAVFGDENTLRELRSKGFSNARFEVASPQGRFINVGDFEDRGEANNRVDRLRDLGFNARVIFRGVVYY